MNEVLASIYRRDEYSLFILLQDHRYKDRKKLDETLRVVLWDDSELQYDEKLHYAEMLLCAGASPNIVNCNGEPLLTSAVDKNDIGIFHMLLNFAPDVDAVDDGDRSVLHAVSERGDADMLGHLLAAGANPNVQDEFGNTPLSLCFEHKNAELLDMFLIDSNVNRVNFDKESPLHLATLCSYTEAVSKLLECGAAVNSQDIHGDTPLMLAAAQTDAATLKCLVKAGANVNQTNLNGNTVLHKACTSSADDMADIVRYLIQSGCKINARNLSGNTPLFVAVDEDNTAAVKILLSVNCDVDMRGNALFGRVCSPLELAMLRDNVVVMAMLLLAGCQFRKEQVDKGVAHLLLSRVSSRRGPDNNEDPDFQKFMDIISYVTAQPPPLLVMCRRVIRKNLGHDIKLKLNNMTLPTKIIDYVLLKELDTFLE